MESTQQSDRESYRAILLRPSGNELLLAPVGDGFFLPSIQIPRWYRVAENVIAAMRNEWGHEVVCLFSADVSVTAGSPNGCHYQVMESRGPLAESSPRGKWMRVTSLSEKVFSDPADYLAVQQSLAECIAHSDCAAPGPFAKLGWFKDLQEWVEEVIGPLGFHLTGSFAQLNASPSFSLVRFETNGPAVWFKAVGKPNLREFPITLALAKLLPQYVPPILGARQEWNGWLALEVEGTNLGETHDPRNWKVAASTLAKLQIESADRGGTLIDLGARDLRASALLMPIRPFLNRMGQLMEEQTKVPPPVLSRSELTWLGEQIEEAVCLNTDLGIPDALGHLDLNPANVILSHGDCVFLDWAEAYVGNPVLSFQYLVEHFRRSIGLNAITDSGLPGAYSEEWLSLVSPEKLARASAFAPMLAVFAYATANDAWNGQAGLQDPKVAGYLRSLTRRIHREANKLRSRSALCPN